MNSPARISASSSPYALVGGGAAVKAFVNRFYDLMDDEPAYAGLRALHGPDLTPMRESLVGFLTAWLGGPRDWFEARPGACVMSAHARIKIDAETAGQWIEVMGRALADTGVEPVLAGQMNAAFARMAHGMVPR